MNKIIILILLFLTACSSQSITETATPLLETPHLSPTEIPLPTEPPTPLPTHTGSGGGVIAYCYQPMSGDSLHQIFAVNLDGSDDRKLIDVSIGLNHHDWSPDAKKIVAVGYLNQSTWLIYTFDVNGSNLTRLTNTQGVWDSEPIWSPDMTQIAFTRIYQDED